MVVGVEDAPLVEERRRRIVDVQKEPPRRLRGDLRDEHLAIGGRFDRRPRDRSLPPAERIEVAAGELAPLRLRLVGEDASVRRSFA